MKKYKSGAAINILAGLVMLIPAVVILISAAESFGGVKSFLQYSLLVCGIVYIFALWKTAGDTFALADRHRAFLSFLSVSLFCF